MRAPRYGARALVFVPPICKTVKRQGNPAHFPANRRRISRQQTPRPPMSALFPPCRQTVLRPQAIALQHRPAGCLYFVCVFQAFRKRVFRGQKICLTYFKICLTYFEICALYFFLAPTRSEPTVTKGIRDVVDFPQKTTPNPSKNKRFSPSSNINKSNKQEAN